MLETIALVKHNIRARRVGAFGPQQQRFVRRRKIVQVGDKADNVLAARRGRAGRRSIR